MHNTCDNTIQPCMHDDQTLPFQASSKVISKVAGPVNLTIVLEIQARPLPKLRTKNMSFLSNALASESCLNQAFVYLGKSNPIGNIKF